MGKLPSQRVKLSTVDKVCSRVDHMYMYILERLPLQYVATLRCEK